MDSDRSEVQSVADLLVGPRRAKGIAIGFEQDARPGDLRAAALPLATSDSNWLRSSADKRTTNFLFMIGLRPRILVKPPELDKSPRNLSIPG